MESQEEAFITAALILKSFRAELSPVEQKKVMDWLNEKPDNRLFYEKLHTKEGLAEEYAFFASLDKNAAWKKIQEARGIKPLNIWQRSDFRYYAAAIIILALSTTAYFKFKAGPEPAPATASVFRCRKAPGYRKVFRCRKPPGLWPADR